MNNYSNSLKMAWLALSIALFLIVFSSTSFFGFVFVSLKSLGFALWAGLIVGVASMAYTAIKGRIGNKNV